MKVTSAVSLRPATAADGDALWHWRNEPSARRMFFNGDPIPLEAHRRWLAAKLGDPALRLLIVVDGAGEAVGYVRCEARGDVGEVSIALAPAARGKGYGTAALREAAARLFAEGTLRALRAYVLPHNAASVRAFERAGFVLRPGVAEVAGHAAHELVRERSS